MFYFISRTYRLKNVSYNVRPCYDLKRYEQRVRCVFTVVRRRTLVVRSKTSLPAQNLEVTPYASVSTTRTVAVTTADTVSPRPSWHATAVRTTRTGARSVRWPVVYCPPPLRRHGAAGDRRRADGNAGKRFAATRRGHAPVRAWHAARLEQRAAPIKTRRVSGPNRSRDDACGRRRRGSVRARLMGRPGE